MSTDCLFCKITAGVIPTREEYRDDKCVVFHDLHPKARVHLLVVPKKHIPTIMDMEEGDETIMGHLMRTAKNVAEAQGLTGYKLQFNVGRDGGQEIMHVHLHLLGE